MESGEWTGRWSIGCAVMFAGFLFLVCLFLLLFAGDTIGDALMASAAAAGLGLAGAGMFGLLEYRDRRQRRRTLAAVRRRLESRGEARDNQACEPVPIEARPFFLEVRTAVAEFLECPPEWLRATDSLQADYRAAEFGWVELEWHVFERMREKLGYEFIDEDLISDKPVEGTLADLAEHVRELLDTLGPPPPPTPPQLEDSMDPAS